ncbi:MAG: hypothetical protein ACI88A_002502 [Paraglaciecola sp.]|jgi:uncharacterized protein YbaP (TraB family)
MKCIKNLSFTIISCVSILVCANSHAASVWKVSSATHSLYIGGTIHILTPEDYPLPKEYAVAFGQSAKIVFETDIQTINSSEFQQQIMARMMYSDGTTLDKVINTKTYAALKQYLQQRDIPIATVAKMKPSLLALTLSMIELQGMGFTSIGVDQFYANLATEKDKIQAWLETPEQQLEFLVNMGEGDKSGLIEYTLRDIKNMPESIGALRTYWRSGDIDGLAKIGIIPFKADYPKIYQELLVTRNNNWLPQIEAMLKDQTVEFVLVGSLHLAGPDSVLNALADKGYAIEKL